MGNMKLAPKTGMLVQIKIFLVTYNVNSTPVQCKHVQSIHALINIEGQRSVAGAEEGAKDYLRSIDEYSINIQ
jgi:hypothetical protein